MRLSPVANTVSCLRDSLGSGWSLVALTVFKTVRDLTTSGWVGSIPMHSRQPLRGEFAAISSEAYVPRL